MVDVSAPMLAHASLAAHASRLPPSVAALALLLAGFAGGCRIYRDAPPSEPVVADEPDAGGARAGEPGEDSPRESVSLWVLNRPEAELSSRRAAEPPPVVSRPGPPPPGPRPEVLVVLGRGADPCVEQLATAGLGALLDGRPPPQVVTGLLEELRRYRWAAADVLLHAHVRSSVGRFGAVQAVAPGGFSAGLLERAAEVHAIADGRHVRWQVPPTSGPPLIPRPDGPDAGAGACAQSPSSALQGPAGVLLRAASGEYHLGRIGADVLLDAGLVPIGAQPALSSAAGPAGAVLLLGDCASVPEAGEAPRVYASSLERGWALPGTGAECPVSYALLGPGGARVSGAGPLAWAVASAPAPPLAPSPAAPLPPSPEPPPAASPPVPAGHDAADAGAAPPAPR